MTDKDQAAFPLFAYVDKDDHSFAEGLTKREYFAAMAMQGFCAAQARPLDRPQDLAELCVKHADALINELNKPI